MSLGIFRGADIKGWALPPKRKFTAEVSKDTAAFSYQLLSRAVCEKFYKES